MKNFLISSADSTQVSLTVKGAVGFIISLATVWFTMNGMPDEAVGVKEQLNAIGDQIVVLIGLVSNAIFVAITLYGLIRKVIYSFIKK